MNQKEFEVVQWLQQRERERLLQNPPKPQSSPQRPTIHWTELAEATPGSRIATEWNFYRRQVGRLLAEGHEGKWVLVKGEEIVGIWDTQKEADQVRAQRFLEAGCADSAGSQSRARSSWPNILSIMPQLTFPITADGLIVDVRVNLDGDSLASLHASGQPCPSSIPGKGLIDTGTDITAVAPRFCSNWGFGSMTAKNPRHRRTGCRFGCSR